MSTKSSTNGEKGRRKGIEKRNSLFRWYEKQWQSWRKIKETSINNNQENMLHVQWLMIVSEASGAFPHFIATFIRAFSTYLLKEIPIIITYYHYWSSHRVGGLFSVFFDTCSFLSFMRFLFPQRVLNRCMCVCVRPTPQNRRISEEKTKLFIWFLFWNIIRCNKLRTILSLCLMIFLFNFLTFHTIFEKICFWICVSRRTTMEQCITKNV